MTRTVLICDDEPDLAAEWTKKVADVATATDYSVRPAHENKDVRHGVQTLLKRRSAARQGQAWADDKCIFDEVDVLVIDYDLIHVDEDNARYTGEGVARLARTYSECSAIVVLNQFPEAQFDLSLRGHLASHADLNVDVELLDRPGLWRGAPFEGFRPWSWPVLSCAVDQQKARVEAILKAGFETPIVKLLGMKPEDAGRLSDTAFGFIAPDAGDFGAFASSTVRSMMDTTPDGRDAAALIEISPKSAAQFAAARLAKWLEREVLGPQDVLTDIPHLLQRFPFLMGDAVNDLSSWNQSLHDKAMLDGADLENAWFSENVWLSRPAVWTKRLEDNAEIRRRRSEFDFSEAPDFVFMEDVSLFGLFDEAQEFRAGFHNAHDRRYAKVLEDIRYAPQRRFAFGG